MTVPKLLVIVEISEYLNMVCFLGNPNTNGPSPEPVEVTMTGEVRRPNPPFLLRIILQRMVSNPNKITTEAETDIAVIRLVESLPFFPVDVMSLFEHRSVWHRFGLLSKLPERISVKLKYKLVESTKRRLKAG